MPCPSSLPLLSCSGMWTAPTSIPRLKMPALPRAKCPSRATINPNVFSTEFRSAMSQPLEDTLVNIWRQAMIEHAQSVDIDGQSYPVKTTKGFGLKQIDFNFGERSLR